MKKATPQHSTIGASTCERWWNCPGSVRAVAAAPKQKSSSFADEGTVAHLVGEWCLRTERDAAEYVGQKAIQILTTEGELRFEFKSELHNFKGARYTGQEIEVTDEMADAVQMYLDTIRFDMSTYDLQVSDIKIEHRFHLAHIDENAYGTNDCNLPVFLDRVIVYDYKHGKGVAVDAEENKQLMYYALGAAELGDYETIEVVIVQPRATHREGPIRRWTISADELKAFGQELRDKIAATRTPTAELVSGPWCKKSFCPAMATCPAVRSRVEADAMVVFDKPVVELPKPDELDSKVLQRILEGMPLIEAWLASIWAYAEQKANNGEKVPGFKLVQGREGHRKWDSELGPIEEILYKAKIGVVAYEEVLKSPTQLEKEVGKTEFKKLLSALVTRPKGKISLVPMSDPREEVAPAATTVFLVEKDSIFN